MSCGNQRPRHARQPSRILRLMDSRRSTADDDRAASQSETSDEIKYIKQVLCVQSPEQTLGGRDSGRKPDQVPLEELLPPLTSSNEIDIQIYAILAVVINQFVQSWYNRITPDQEFVAQIVQIIAHCTRGFEQRFRTVDLEELLFDEVPALVISHVDAIRVARNACSGYRSDQDVRSIYHAVRPHQALSPLPDDGSTSDEQDDNESAWCQLLVSRILRLVLPPEDLQNSGLYVFVSEMFAEVIVRNAICKKASEPWLLWGGITKMIHTLQPGRNPQQAQARQVEPSASRLEQLGLLSTTEQPTGTDFQKAHKARAGTFAQMLGLILHLVMETVTLVRSFAMAIMHAPSLPARAEPLEPKSLTTPSRDTVGIVTDGDGLLPDSASDDALTKRRLPVVGFRLWECVLRAVSLDRRMPWLTGLLWWFQWMTLHGPARVGRLDSTLDRLLSSQIQQRLLSQPSHLVSLLRAVRGALFPDNALGLPQPPPTTDDELQEIKRSCAAAIVALITPAIRRTYFATEDEAAMREDVERTMLDLIADPYINKHLLVSAVDLIAVRLFPELTEEELDP